LRDESEPEFTCELCEYMCRDGSTLKKHRREHAGEDNQKAKPTKKAKTEVARGADKARKEVAAAAPKPVSKEMKKQPAAGLDLSKQPPWCRAVVEVDIQGYFMKVNGNNYAIEVTTPPAFATAMVKIELHEKCKDWLGKVVRIGPTGAVGTVASSNLPLKLLKHTSTEGLLDCGHLRLTNVKIISSEKLSKLRKNMLVDLNGTTFEQVNQRLSDCYVLSSCLTLLETSKGNEESETDN
jgi:hypothetical protein